MEVFIWVVFMHIVVALHVLVIVVIFTWPKIYRWAFFPKRDPDFKHRLYVYWFDEKVAYSTLAEKKRLRFHEDDKGVLWEGPLGSNQWSFSKLEPEIQEAYKNHIHTKFEEMFLS
jgi:hypothetical protein